MNAVEPIRDREKVQDIADYLKSKNERDYVLWMFGIYTALRVSDILKMRVRDVKNKDYIIMREQKTNNERKFVINKKLRKAIDHYIKDKPGYELLFKSRQGQEKAISRQQAYNIIKEAAAHFGIYNVGTHTMRKTFGYHMYMKTKDGMLLMKIFGHSDVHITLRYIGVEQDTINKAMATFNLAY